MPSVNLILFYPHVNMDFRMEKHFRMALL
jgi:hypothetical protein